MSYNGWIDPADAIKHLFHEHQRWAVQNALKKKYESV